MAWPNANNTGVPAGAILTPSGPVTSSSDGQIIEYLDVDGYITVNHDDVTVRYCKVRNGPIAIHGNDVTVSWCTVTPIDGWNSGIFTEGASRAKIKRNNVSQTENGISLGNGSGHVVRYNYIHDLFWGGGRHSDGIPFHVSTPPISNVLIANNNLDLPCEVSSSITLGNASTVTINNNRLNGGTYTLYIEDASTFGVRVTNNRFGCHVYGYLVDTAGGLVEYSGNVDDATGNPIVLP
jgi:parallel beta-helix repeat protein